MLGPNDNGILSMVTNFPTMLTDVTLKTQRPVITVSECTKISSYPPLIIAALDVQKAFDIVNHDSLLCKLYLDWISGNDWLYTGMTAEVKWDWFLSSLFAIKQGVCQGRILSASHYKRYNNPLLIDVEDRFTGKKIGTVRIPYISVADDVFCH